MRNSLSIILPAFNEAYNIVPATRDILEYCRRAGLDHEVIIVNDGSRDATGPLADEVAAESPFVRVIHHAFNEGYGRALRNGFSAAKHDLLFFTDSDRQFQIEDLDKLLALMDESDADIVIGYRLDRQDPIHRKATSQVFNTLVRLLLGIPVKDVNCAFKLFRKSVFERIEVESTDFAVNSEILAKARLFGFKVAEVGVTHLPRRAGRSTVRPAHVLSSFRGLLRVRRALAELRRDMSLAL